MKKNRLWVIGFFAVALIAAVIVPTKIPYAQDNGEVEVLIAGRNVNMVSGTTLPYGDPYLQRQNEPSLAVSSRNPMHLLAGSNDYRTVDMPIPQEELPGFEVNAAADAWVSYYTSDDGGESWKTTLLPGFPQDTSTVGMNSPLKAYSTAADPRVWAGTEGRFYYSGLAFNRDIGDSAVFVARFVDRNDQESGETIDYQGITIVQQDDGKNFLDMPSIAGDVPRGASDDYVYLVYTWFDDTNENEIKSQILFSRSTDGGLTWSKSEEVTIKKYVGIVQCPRIAVDPANGDVYVVFRQFSNGGENPAIMIAKSTDRGQNFTDPQVIATFTNDSFDQPATANEVLWPDPDDYILGESFRTNSYASIAVNKDHRVFVAYAQRGFGNSGEARIVLWTGLNGTGWDGPYEIGPMGFDPTGRPYEEGHQFMPQISISEDVLTFVWYDQHEDWSAQNYGWGDWISDHMVNPQGDFLRRTIDVCAAQVKAPLYADPSKWSFTQVSRYLYALALDSNGDIFYENGEPVIIPVQFNCPNLPMFKGGKWPFIGDYIAIAPSKQYKVVNGDWLFNSEPSGNHPIFHVAWTDNRDVRPPTGNWNWTDYVPVNPSGQPGEYISPGREPCDGNVGNKPAIRNQNVYTATLTRGVLAAAPSNEKADDLSVARSFVIYVKNNTEFYRSFRLSIYNQPPSGFASFFQFGDPVTEIDAVISPFSTISRQVFVDGTNAPIRVEIEETDASGAILPEGLKSYVAINGDPSSNGVSGTEETHRPVVVNPDNPNIVNWVCNPNIVNPNIVNPNIVNPNIVNPNIVNPNIVNPNIVNPNIVNPNIVNPNIVNPNIVNPNIVNPNIVNPNIVNPNIVNPNIVNATDPDAPAEADITDVAWTVKNEGNTTTSYTLLALTEKSPPPGVYTQLIVYRTHYTPAVAGEDLSSEIQVKTCQVKEEPSHELLLNILNPNIVNPNIVNPNIVNPNIVNPNIVNPNIVNASILDASFALAPGEEAYVNLRVMDTAENTEGQSLTASQDPFSIQAFDVNEFISSIGFVITSLAVDSQDAAQDIRVPKGDATDVYIVSSNPPDGLVDISYEAYISAFGGTPPYTWALNSGVLPPGLNISTYHNPPYYNYLGKIDGTPTAVGTYSFVVQVTDADGKSDIQLFSITIHQDTSTLNTPDITTLSLPSGVVGTWYGAAIDVAGGNQPLTWSWSGFTPEADGLILDPLSGIITGTPTVAATYTFDVTVTDYDGDHDTVTYNLDILDSTGNYFIISGTVYDDASNPLEGVQLYGLPNSPVTDIYGHYEDSVPEGWSGTVIPFKLNHFFTPENRVYTQVSSHQYGQDYNQQEWYATQSDVVIVTDMVIDPFGNAYISGTGNTGAYVAKYDDTGTFQWDFRDGSSVDDIFDGLCVDPDGNVYVTGKVNNNIKTVKLHPDTGLEQWSDVYDSGYNDDKGLDIAMDALGNFYVTGCAGTSAPEIPDACTIKYEQSGGTITREWVNIYDDGDHDYGLKIAIDPEGNIVVAGYNASPPYTTHDDYLIIKYDTYGTEEWSQTYDGGDSQDYLHDMCLDAAGNVYVTGRKETGTPNSADYLTAKFDSSGTFQWKAEYDGANHYDDWANAITVDADGYVYVTGRSGEYVCDDPYVCDDYATIKYDPNGNPVWTPGGYIDANGAARYDGAPGGDHDVAEDIEVDPFGNVYVTGRSVGNDGSFDFATLIYDSSGTKIWEGRYDNNSRHDEAQQIELDPEGNIFVSGPTGADLLLLKYSQSFPTSLSITTEALPNGVALMAYNAVLEAFGGTGSYAWDIIVGALPDGLFIDGPTGVIFGTPTTAGTFNFTVEVSDGTLTDSKPMSITIVLPAIPPEINIKQNGTGIADDGSYDFGSQTVGTDTDVIFTIENLGTGDLTITTPITIGGTDSDQFSVPIQPSSSVSSGDSTTFTLRFSPTSEGAKSASISIGNNDSDESPYDIALTGTAVAIGPAWAKTYGGSDTEWLNSIQQTPDGGYILTGGTSSFGAGDWDIWVLKLDSAGGVVWQKTYGGPSTDDAYYIQQTSDSGYIVAGKTSSFGAGNADMWVLKLDAVGDVVWQKTYGGIIHEYAFSIQQTPDGGFILAGDTNSFGAGDWDFWVLKLDAVGDVEWQKTYGGPDFENQYRIQQTSDGGFILAGRTLSFGAGDYDSLVLKLDSGGDIEWQKTYGGSADDDTQDIQQTSDGGYILAGLTNSFGAGDWDSWVLKLDATGDIVWQKRYDGSVDDSAHYIQLASDGGFIVSAWTDSFGAGGSDSWVLKLDSAGDIVWQKTYGGSADDYPGSIQQTSDGGYIIGADTYSFGAGDLDLWVLKLRPDGSIDPSCSTDLGAESTAIVASTSVTPSTSTATAGDSTATTTDTSITPADTSATVQTQCVAIGLPHQLAFSQQPSNTAAGSIITPAVTVEIQDQWGNLVTTATDTVSLSLQNAGGATLDGTTSKPAVGGIATFDDLSIDEIGTGYFLRANSGSLTESDSIAFDIISSIPLQATSSAMPTSGLVPLLVNFTGNATGGTPPYSYSWTFGDSGSSTQQNPSHTYVASGTYNALLTVTDSASQTDSADPIIISAGGAAVPEINIKQDTIDIDDGTGYDFGSQVIGSDTDVVFTIENLGDADLTITTPISIAGTDADQFSVQAQPSSPVIPAGSTTFTIQFSPTSVGAKSASIAIGNNDSDENPYDIALTGTAEPDQFTKILSGAIVDDAGYSRRSAWGDYNNDGYLDLFVANRDENFLYRNNGDGSFTKITDGDVVTDVASSSGCSWGDYNNDGYLDLFVANTDQNNFLYRNNGDDSFSKITDGDVVTDAGDSRGCAWGDYDNDGHLDLFVSNYGQNFLYRNNGDGSFTKSTDGDVVMDDVLSSSCAWGDYDNDGDSDLFVASWGYQNNFLYRNNGDGSFTKITDGVVVTDVGRSTGCAWGDYDNDGDLDLFVSNADMPQGNNYLYRNNGDSSFTKIVDGDVVTDEGYFSDCAWGDYDNDGLLDLFVANDFPIAGAGANNFLYKNNGDGTFAKVTNSTVVTDGGDSAGCAWSDYDNDGDLDLFVANWSQNNFLYENNGNSNNWINIDCTGVASNVSAIGSKVKVNATIGGDSIWQLKEISGGTGSQDSLNAEFGLGDAAVIDEVQVLWPSGQTQVLPTVTPNQFLTITEPLLPAPTVLSMDPSSGTTANDTLNVTISGSDFYNGAIVELNFDGADPVTATGVTFMSGSELQCVFDLTSVSTHIGEAWDIKVTNPGGTFGIGEDLFTIYLPDPTVSSIDPDTGTVGDPYLVTITGTNFVSGASVKLTKSGETDIDATGVSVDSDTQITCSIDLTGAVVGAWDVVVTVPGADSPGTLLGGFTVSAPPTFPEINIRQDTTDIANGGSYSFGSQAIGSNTDVIFTIENLGDADLTITTPLEIGGFDPDQFSVQAQPTSPVTPAGSTTFTIRFSPTSVGSKSVSISITNNDSDENPYHITLMGTVPDPFVKYPALTDIVDDGGYFCAWGDYDNDSDLDLFVSNNNENNCLYTNNGNGYFTKVISGAVVTDGGASRGCAWGDYDNDGDLDLFVSNNNENNFLYTNNGDGSFTPVTTGDVVTDGGFSTSCAWGDYDNDGDLDLFVANVNQNNFLYTNNGDGSFTKVNSGAVVTDGGASYGCAWGDYDNDGNLDLFVANVYFGNFLYTNNGDGSFTKVTTGDVVEDLGYNSYGCAWGDYDNDGDLDLFVTNYGGDNNFLYTNNGDGSFTKVNSGAVVTDGGDSHGCGWGDYDNDGDLDLFVANAGGENNFLYTNNGDGSFTKVTSGMIVTDGGYSGVCAWGDYDNDGILDLFVTNGLVGIAYGNFLYSYIGDSNNWINIECVGTSSNVSAIGAKVKANSIIGGTPVWQLREISGGTLGQDSLNAEFGLGDATVIDEIQVLWPSGQIQVLPTVSPNQFLTITEPLLPAPTVLSINPTTGTTADDTLNVTISGSDFYNGAIVEMNFNGADPVTATGVTFVSGSELQCVFDLTSVSTNLGDNWDLKVTNPGGMFGIGEDLFTIYIPNPTVSSIDPDTGTVGDIYLVTITGTNFVSGASVKLTKSSETDIDATGVSVDSDTQITCSIDLIGAAVGAWDVVVIQPGAESTGTLLGGFTVSAPPTFPEINIKQDTTDIGDGGGYDFGSQAIGSNTDVIFTIENLGDANLTITTPISITGTDADQFSVLEHPTSPVTPAGSATFTIRFNPTSVGSKSASISITNNDADENPYDITLTGTAVLDEFNKMTSGTIVEDGANSYVCAWGDYDNDGDLDLFVANINNENNFLYTNNGDGNFTKVTSGAIVTDGGNSSGCSWGDYDNDGDLDLFVANNGIDNFLYTNNGDGSFTKVTSGAVVTDGGGSIGCSWGDYNNDGDLDLFVANHDNENNFLYTNNGDGSFTKVTSGAVVTDGGESIGCAWGDYDNDGDLDLFVANSILPDNNNFLYTNNGDGSFTKVTSGAVVTDGGYSYGCAWGDYDNDGDLDLFVANSNNENNFLYTNNGDGNFTKVTTGAVVTDGGRSVDCAWGDYDNDGDLDLFVSNYNNQNNCLYTNNGDGNFTKVTSGVVVMDGGESIGCAWGDYDNDGDLDLFVANYFDQNNCLYTNNGNSNNWINIECVGTASNVSSIGAKVKANSIIGGIPIWQLREISGGTYSQDSLNAEFGLGDATVIDEIQVLWPSGQIQVLPTVTPNQFLIITEPLLPAPTVLSMDPTTGTTADDTLNVTISGSDFYNGAIVELNFNGADPVTATGVTFVSGSELQCVFDLIGVSDHLGEVWDIKVTNPGGTFGIGEDIFTIYLPDPTVSSIVPDTGTVGDTYLATITGTNFVSGASVKLTKSGETDIDATGVSVDSDTQITCSIDLTGAAVGAWDVVVTVPGAESAGTLPGGFTVTAPPAFPEINIRQDTTDISDGNGYDFGSQAIGSNKDVIFTIENLGDADLTVTSPISITGTDADQFSVQAHPTSPVTPAGSTTFTIRFSPTSEGAKSASIAIGNNDSDENPYDITLTGTAVPPDPFTNITTGSIVGDGGYSDSCAWGDYDNDGDLDLFVANFDQNNFLYTNNGDGSFTPVTTGNVVTDGGSSWDCAWGDYDNDGDLDLFVANDLSHGNFLYSNDGDATFTKVSTGVVVTDSGWCTSGAWGDYDNDGDIDLFVTDYNQNNFLYSNDGDATFTKVSTGVVVTDGGSSVCGAWGDYDNDGDLDLFVANYTQPNYLYRNDGSGNFTKVLTGDVVTDEGNSNSGAWGDYDNDGDLDLFVANFNQNNFLYLNDGDGTFTKVSTGVVVTDGGFSYGGAWGDYDNDGDLDLFVANTNDQGNFLYSNNGDGSFTKVSTGVVVTDGGFSVSGAWGDYDNDGDLDLFVANDNQDNFLYANNGNSNNWINIKCVGTTSNNSAIGTSIKVTANIGGMEISQYREVSGGMFSQDSLSAEFGLGDATIVDTITVLWPSGGGQIINDVATNQFLSIVESAVPAPTITSIDPTSGTTDWFNVDLSILGTNFVDGADVYIDFDGADTINPTLVTFLHDSLLTGAFTLTGVTEHLGEAWDVTVVNPDAQSFTLENAFTIYLPDPTVTGISPPSGVNTAPVSVTITGTNFVTGVPTNIRLRKLPGPEIITATGVSVDSDTQITCQFDLTGATPGAWDVVVGFPTVAESPGVMSGGFNVTTGGSVATKIEVTGPDKVGGGFVSEAFTITAQDDIGTPSPVAQNTVFNLSSDSTGTSTFYSDEFGTIPITQATIQTGETYVKIYYKDDVVGTPTVTATWASGGSDLGFDSHQTNIWPVIGQILFTSSQDGNQEIYQMNSDGSGQIRLTNNSAADITPCWSPDGSKIAFGSNRDGNNEIYVMNADGSGQTNLTNNPAYDGDPCWSPDGSKIAFYSQRDGNNEIYVMNVDGSDQTNLTNHISGDRGPSWSPDGSKIAFYSGRDGNSEIYVMNANGTNQTRETNNTAFDAAPRWSPDGSKIAFYSDRDGNLEVYIMDANGSNQTRLTNDPADDNYPDWSPDGSTIVFNSNRDGDQDIYVINADGINVTQLTDNVSSDSLANWGGAKIAYTSNGSLTIASLDGTGKTKLLGGLNRRPAWSPDGMKIAFDKYSSGVWEIYVMNADGSGLSQITTDPTTNEISPCWSPYGDKIAFVSDRDGNNQIYIMNADGSGQTRVTNHSGSDGDPNWSPYGDKIVFHSSRAGDAEIFTIRPDGSDETQLTSNASEETSPCYSTYDFGSNIVFSSNRDGNFEIYRMDKYGNNQTRLTSSTGDDVEPCWSPDGRKIIFQSDRDGNDELYIINADGSGETRITDNSVSDEHPSWRPQARVLDVYEYHYQFGSFGDFILQFNTPWGVATDSSGNVYIADSGNHKIQNYDLTGGWLDWWGSQGSGNGQFNGPLGVACDSSGNIYVADTGNNRIQKFNSSKVFLTKWGSSGTGDGQFNLPEAIAVDSSGNVYVADTENHRIQKFNSSGGFLAKWGSMGSADGQLRFPRGIAVDSLGYVYVTDADNHRIQKFNSSGGFVTKWGSSGTGDGQLNYPWGIAVANSGYVFVVDRSNNRVQKFSSNGKFITKWGSAGTGDGEFDFPRGIAVGIDYYEFVYVVDAHNHRVQIFRKFE